MVAWTLVVHVFGLVFWVSGLLATTIVLSRHTQETSELARESLAGLERVFLRGMADPGTPFVDLRRDRPDCHQPVVLPACPLAAHQAGFCGDSNRAARGCRNQMQSVRRGTNHLAAPPGDYPAGCDCDCLSPDSYFDPARRSLPDLTFFPDTVWLFSPESRSNKPISRELYVIPTLTG